MAKYFLSVLILVFAASASFGQTTKPKSDAVKNDPATTQTAAQADVQLTNNKEVTDNSAVLKTLREKRKQHRAFRKKTLPRRSS